MECSERIKNELKSELVRKEKTEAKAQRIYFICNCPSFLEYLGSANSEEVKSAALGGIWQKYRIKALE